MFISVIPAAFGQQSDELPSILDDAQKSLESKTSNKSNTSPQVDNGIEGVQYTSQKYHIQFQYPADWTVSERANRFEEGTDITVTSANSRANIGIMYFSDSVDGFGTTDLNSAISSWVNTMQLADYTNEYRTVESPSFMNIDGKRTGTVVYTSKERYGTYPLTMASQTWITFVGTGGYMIGFITSADTFDSPENIEVRDQFIKSIHFLDGGLTGTPLTPQLTSETIPINPYNVGKS